MSDQEPDRARDPADAARTADEQLRRQYQQWGPIHRLMAAFGQLALENHFSERIARAIRGEP